MRRRLLAPLAYCALAACSAGQPGNREEAAPDDGPLVSHRSLADDAGGELLYEARGALSRDAAQRIADIWAASLDRLGIRAYEIVHVPPNRIQVRIYRQLFDPATVKNTLRSAYGVPEDIYVVQERTFP